MAEKVKVTIEATYRDENGASDSVKNEYPGEIHLKNGFFMVIYQDNPEESGFDKVMLKIGKEALSVTKRNSRENKASRMEFEKGRKYETDYEMCGAYMKMNIEDVEICVNQSTDNICVDLSYSLLVNGDFVSKNEMKINVCRE